MQYTISVYDEKDRCKVCGSHVSEMHKDGCEVGVIRKELHAAQLRLHSDKAKGLRVINNLVDNAALLEPEQY